MLKKQVTYDGYSGEKEEVLSLNEMLLLFDRMNWVKGAYMYFPIDEKYIFQLYCENENIFTIEFTDTETARMYQKRVNKQECRDAIVEVFEKTQMQPDMLNGYEEEKPKTLYNSVRGNRWKKALFWIAFVGFFLSIAILGAYLIYW